ncbi:cobyric acid synthase [Methylobacterium organophilum]|uniref:cobyric acid synthase n=1 Tax=Methylobacterium organophilum TaxID=410 RepID=UPI001F13DC1D|nr:cobyric acid synthase [Methylobacterium organophilum]UMY19815.1 cobyric acid synthase [Methylobacterium organophilum]
MTRALMIQGTGSDVGKSLIVAGLARAFTRAGLAVRPFKPQNMSNNAAVTADGGEIGRAQALQARAARVPPSVHMNPVLLKPQSDVGAQVVVQGRMVGTARARDYQEMKPKLLASVLDSYARLRGQADLVLVEGAGSPAEVNLRRGDIANMGFARAAGVPVVLVGDIDRGGVIASLVGTKVVIEPEDAAMIRGFLVNRFRGDPSLFDDGMAIIAQRTGWAPLGLVPHFPEAAHLPPEDALALDQPGPRRLPGAPVVAVPVFPHIANFDDLDPLRQEPGVEVVFVRPGLPLPERAALIVLPGSKTTIDDLAFARAQGWDADLRAHLARGRPVLGLCGGYQMMGRSIDDPHGIEGAPRRVEGLGLLDLETVMTPEKRLVAVSGTSVADGVPFAGYEMHVGDTTGPDAARPLLRFSDGRPDGAVSADGRVCGTYVHGLFADDRQRAAWLARIGAAPSGDSYEAGIDAVLDRFADHLEAHVDCERLLALAGSRLS